MYSLEDKRLKLGDLGIAVKLNEKNIYPIRGTYVHESILQKLK